MSYVNRRACNGMWETWVKQMCGSSRSYGFTKFWIGSINFGCGFKIRHGFKIWCRSKIGLGPNFGVGLRFGVSLKFAAVQILAWVQNLPWF